MNLKNPKFLSDLPNKLLNDVQTSHYMFPIHFLSGTKICKIGTTITQGFSYIKLMVFYPQFGGKDEGIIGHSWKKIFPDFL